MNGTRKEEEKSPHPANHSSSYFRAAAGKPSSAIVGLWIELSEAALADSYGEGLIRWSRAFVRGLDQLPDVQRIIIPCAKSAQPQLIRLFSDAAEDDRPSALISKKLEFPALIAGNSLLSRVRSWADRKRKRSKERLESLEVTPNPLTWPHALLALAKESPSSLGLLLLSCGRLAKILTTTIGLGLSEAIRPFVRHIASPGELLARKANQAFPNTTWILPNPGWPSSSLLRGRKLLNIADIVYREFPLPGVSATELELHAESLMLNAVAADKIICFSQHVARKHIAQAIPAASHKTVVVPHAPFPTRPPAMTAEESRKRLGNALRQHFTTSLPSRHYCDFPFEAVDYLVVSSKCRPYKNYAAVLDAYEYVLRRARRNVKLIVTAHLSGNPELREQLCQHGLVFDVAEATNLPDEIHTLLIQNAKMLVVPTLFEGGMPFGFSEAVGLGTPCAMPLIPAVEEALHPDELSGQDFFRPTDTDSLTRSILHILDNRDAVLAKQQNTRARLLRRTWRDVASEYLAPSNENPLCQ